MVPAKAMEAPTRLQKPIDRYRLIPAKWDSLSAD